MKSQCKSTKHKDGHALNALDDPGLPEPEVEIGQLELGGLVSLNAIVNTERLETAVAELCTLTSTTRVMLGVDSGAGVSVWPTKLCDDYPTRQTAASRSGTSYASAQAGSSAIVNRGERTLELHVGSEARAFKAQVCDVRKPLLSVSEMNDAGHDVHFLTATATSAGRAFAVHNVSGQITPFVRSKGVFEIEAQVPAFQGKPGQAQKP